MRHLLCFRVFCFCKAPELDLASTHGDLVLHAPAISCSFGIVLVHEILLTGLAASCENKVKGREMQSGGFGESQANLICAFPACDGSQSSVTSDMAHGMVSAWS